MLLSDQPREIKLYAERQNKVINKKKNHSLFPIKDKLIKAPEQTKTLTQNIYFSDILCFACVLGSAEDFCNFEIYIFSW